MTLKLILMLKNEKKKKIEKNMKNKKRKKERKFILFFRKEKISNFTLKKIEFLNKNILVASVCKVYASSRRYIHLIHLFQNDSYKNQAFQKETQVCIEPFYQDT